MNAIAIAIGEVCLNVTLQTALNLLPELAEHLKCELYFRNAAGDLQRWSRNPKPAAVTSR
ncbi:MAG: hypothetical protein ACK4X1_10270 [Terricaulis sp.]